MALENFEANVAVHSGLGNDPNIENNLSADELKSLFDFPAVAIKDWINNVLVPAVNAMSPESSLAAFVQELKPVYYPCIWFKPLAGGNQQMYLIDRNGTTHDLNPKTIFEGVSIGEGAVKEANIDADAVTEVKIKDGSVTENKIGSGAVTKDKIGPGAVNEDKLTNTAVKLTYQNVAASSWVLTNTYSKYPYVCQVYLDNASETMTPEIIFGLDDATSGRFAPIAETFRGGVFIYASTNPGSITIPNIILWR